MQGLPIIGSLCVAFWLASPACAFNITSRTLSGSEGGVYTVAYIQAIEERFALVVPNDWKARAAELPNALTLTPPSGESPIAVTFWSQPSAGVLADANTMRQVVAPFIKEPALLDEFPVYSAYGTGRGADYSFIRQGLSMRSRLVVIPTAHGFVSFGTVCSAEREHSYVQALGETLTSFRSAPITAEEESAVLAGSVSSETPTRSEARAAAAILNFEELHTEPTPSAPPPPPPRITIFEKYRDLFLLGLMLVLGGIVTMLAQARFKAEAEYRELNGGYLSDGTAVASFKMPDLFAPTPVAPLLDDASPLEIGATGDDPYLAAKQQMAAFLAQAPNHLAELDRIMEELDRAGDDAAWRKTLAELPRHVTALKEQANFWEVRPVWQLSSALEVLVKRVAERSVDAKPSTMRTITAAINVLHTLCVPGIRPNLIIDPPIQILAVDDDPLCQRALVLALQKVSLVPDVAANGLVALEMASKKGYEVIFMDVQMPEMDGITACQRIRETELNGQTPVVFVTIQSDFHTRIQSGVHAGQDVMAKPFLVFEMTVKALMYAMCKRLANASVRVPAAVPHVKPAVSASPATAPVRAEPVVSGRALPVSTEIILESAPERARLTIPEKRSSNGKMERDFFIEAPPQLASLKQVFDSVVQVEDEAGRPEKLETMKLWTQALGTLAKLAHVPVTARLTSALQALLKRLHENPRTITPSTLNTVGEAFRQLEMLCVPGVEEKLSGGPPVRILVVEDEPLARRAIVGALQLVFEKPESAEDGGAALRLTAQKPYDVIFTDAEMPVINGFEFCRRVRADGPNQEAPVVFITSRNDHGAQTKAAESGGTDFITKPFLPVELAVKALTRIWDYRLQQIQRRPVPLAPLNEHDQGMAGFQLGTSMQASVTCSAA